MDDERENIEMIADYMEKGFLDNIIDMFKHDPSLFGYLGVLISDERSRVRIGAVVLVESLIGDFPNEIYNVIPNLAEALKSSNPTVRGDAAFILGATRNKNSLPYLTIALEGESSSAVKAVIQETIEELGG